MDIYNKFLSLHFVGHNTDQTERCSKSGLCVSTETLRYTFPREPIPLGKPCV